MILGPEPTVAGNPEDLVTRGLDGDAGDDVEATPDSGRRRESASSEALLAAFVRGDEQAFSTLVDRYSCALHNFLTLRLPSRDDADDVLQEIWTLVFKNCRQFDTARRFQPWLYAIASHAAIDLQRSIAGRRWHHVSLNSQSHTQEGDDGVGCTMVNTIVERDALTAEQAYARSETRYAVDSLIQTLPEGMQQLIDLRFMQDHKYKEIAALLGIPIGTVKSRLHATMQKLRTAFHHVQMTRTQSAA